MFTAIWNVLLELAPWLLLGTIVAAVLHVLLPKDWIRRQFRGYGGVAKAVAFGVPMPLCSCGVIPAGLGLKKDGASDGAVVGFLVSTPQTGVDSILVSASFLGLPFALFKVASATLTGLIAGWWTHARSGDAAPPPEPAETATAPAHGLAAMFGHGIEILRSIWVWLVFGVVVSAAITVFVPHDALAGLSRFGAWGAGAVALVVSLPLYVCATASVPIAAALVGAGMPAGAALVFLMAGPATNVATIGAIYKTLGKQTLAIYLVTIIVGSLALGTLFDGVIGGDAVPTHADHVHATAWWSTAAAVALTALLAWFLVEEVLGRTRRTSPASGQETVIGITGMNCANCVRRVEKALHGTDGVTAVVVDLEAGQATVSGSATQNAMRRAIEAAGYTPQ